MNICLVGVGAIVGAGAAVAGAAVGAAGAAVGVIVGAAVGAIVAAGVGAIVGAGAGAAVVGAGVASSSSSPPHATMKTVSSVASNTNPTSSHLERCCISLMDISFTIRFAFYKAKMPHLYPRIN